MWWCESPIAANKVDPISKLPSQLAQMLLLYWVYYFASWELSLGKWNMRTSVGILHSFLRLVLGCNMPAMRFEALAPGHCGHFYWVEALGKLADILWSVMSQVCAVPCLPNPAGTEDLSKPEKSSQWKAGGKYRFPGKSENIGVRSGV